MSTDPQTLAFYDENAESYAAFAEESATHPRLATFLAEMPANARLLDFGCGNGWAAAAMAEAGHRVEAIDASRGLAEQARQKHGIEVRVAPFHTLSYRARYDGIWCHFALQHADRASRPAIFERLHTALKPGGLLYVGTQKGPRDWRDELGRLYCPFREEEMINLLETADFGPPDLAHGTGKNYDGTPTLNLYVFVRA